LSETDDPARRLEAAARMRGYPASALPAMLAYLRAMLERDRDVNLTGARDLGEAVDKVAVSALAVVAAWPAARPPGLVVDLGTGNGFPGVAAALAWPTARVLLVERRAKKARAVADALTDAGIAGAQAVPCDGRDLVRLFPEVAGAVDLVTVRATGPLDATTREALPWLARGGRIAHWKGASLSDEERRAGTRAAREGGLRVLPEPSLGRAPPGPAHLIVYERP
jgi:16S rRNA (guanine527-N7)-methyltransferase